MSCMAEECQTMSEPRRQTSPLFTLPTETRLNIYRFLIPNNILYIDLCTTRRPNADAFFGIRRQSIMSTLRMQIDEINNITRINGIHLLLVCRQTQSEVLQLFSKVKVRFHCPECWKTFLPNVARGLGVGLQWIKHVEIMLDIQRSRQMGRAQIMTMELAKTMAREAMQTSRKLGWTWYGMLYLSDKEKWQYGPVEEYGAADSDSIELVAWRPNRQDLVGQQSHTSAMIHPNLGPHGRPGEATPMTWVITAQLDI